MNNLLDFKSFFKFLSRNYTQVLSGKSYAVVSETFANGAFGGRSPIEGVKDKS